MKIIVDKNFETREELDTYVRTTFGENVEANSVVRLEVDAETRTKLQLSEDVTVHGVRVVPEAPKPA